MIIYLYYLCWYQQNDHDCEVNNSKLYIIKFEINSVWWRETIWYGIVELNGQDIYVITEYYN